MAAPAASSCTGRAAPPVSGHHGLTVDHDGFGTIIRNLVINNFADDGIFIDADEVSVFGCFIGTDATGMMAVPNQGFGVQVFGGNGVRIGGATSGGPCAGDCNVISGAIATRPTCSWTSTPPAPWCAAISSAPMSPAPPRSANNALEGIVDKGSGNRIGGANGTTPGGSCTGDCNLISGNNVDGGVFIDPGGDRLDRAAATSSARTSPATMAISNGYEALRHPERRDRRD